MSTINQYYWSLLLYNISGMGLGKVRSRGTGLKIIGKWNAGRKDSPGTHRFCDYLTLITFEFSQRPWILHKAVANNVPAFLIFIEAVAE